MSDDQQPGPELDRRVAEILEYSVDYANGDPLDFDGEHDMHFSTNPACQREMLHWLRNGEQDSDWVELGVNRYCCHAGVSICGEKMRRDGTTIEHALALLVCAVAEREAK